MATFRTPTDDYVRYGDDTKFGLQRRLWRFFEPEKRGRNVYRLTDGTYTEVDQRDTGQVDRIYLGGHVYDLSATEVADLTAAGYGAYIT